MKGRRPHLQIYFLLNSEFRLLNSAFRYCFTKFEKELFNVQ
jgi:hypothetical protein